MNEREARINSDHHIDRSAHSLILICCPDKIYLLEAILLKKKKMISFSTRYHVVRNYGTLCI